ncbi:MAG: hypothetical protein IT184_16105 [Acidobacteria bacterium]|nr:hypothetical protein [Acidobacteriota bacterium]
MRRQLSLATTSLALVGCLAASAQAQNLSAPPTKDIYFTFSQPVVVPNKTLDPGRYLFRLEGRDRQIVQIYSGDRAKLIHTAMAVGSMRADQPERPEVRLIESSASAPTAIGSWWYPEMRQGWEFVYPRQQAMTIAKTATEPILTTRATVPAGEVQSGQVESGELVRLEPGGNEVPYVASSESRPAQPRGIAQVGDIENGNGSVASANSAASTTRSAQGAAGGSAAGRVQAQASNAAGRSELPRTAGNEPAIALVSLIALAAAFALRRRIAL